MTPVIARALMTSEESPAELSMRLPDLLRGLSRLPSAELDLAKHEIEDATCRPAARIRTRRHDQSEQDSSLRAPASVAYRTRRDSD